ncbi:hypothetical protein BX589_11669 [Paraburkholderia fungorum]|jgi:hypothetical protein|nr:hypothetical protein BX589_11669 [Paraburkholderia fungorum]
MPKTKRQHPHVRATGYPPCAANKTASKTGLLSGPAL